MPDTDTDSKNDGKTPEFEGEFDADRAARLVANLRSDLNKARADLKTATDALAAKDDAEKSEIQKANDRAAKAEKEAAKAKTDAARERIARKHNLPDDLAEFLTGDTDEEIEAKAKSLASYAKKEDSDGKEPKKGDLPAKPKSRLVPGHTSDDDGDVFDPRAIAERIREQQ